MKRKLLSFVLIAVIIVNAVVSLCGCSAGSKLNKEYLKLLKDADQALADGNIEDALSAYQQAIELEPTVPQAYHRMFDTYVRDERFNDAIKFALDNYQSISTEMTEQSDVPYKEENSLYADMTPRQEAALFYLNAMDLGLHKKAALDNDYPQTRMAKYVTYVNDTQEAINDEELTSACDNVMDISSKYADIVTRMREAGVLVEADLNGMSQVKLLESGLGAPDPEAIGETSIKPTSLITLETAAAFEKELRELLERDPDLLFLYFDIANLYIEAGDCEQAQLVYQEAQQALKDMSSRRGYITEAAVSLFDAQFINLYNMGFTASANLTGRVNGYFRFYRTGDKSKQTKTAEQYQEALSAANAEKDSLPLTESENRTIQSLYNSYYQKLNECIDNMNNTWVNESLTNTTEVEGDADLLAFSELPFKSDTSYHDNTWLHVYTDSSHDDKSTNYQGASYLINVNNGEIIYGAEGDDPIACEDAIIGFKFIEPELNRRVSIEYITGGLPGDIDLYAVTYDLQGNQLSQEKIYEVPESTEGGKDISRRDFSSEFWSKIQSAMEEATSGHTRSNGISAEVKAGHLDGNNYVFEVSGVKFRKADVNDPTMADNYARCYVYEDIVVLNWQYGFDNNYTEIYRLK